MKTQLPEGILLWNTERDEAVLFIPNHGDGHGFLLGSLYTDRVLKAVSVQLPTAAIATSLSKRDVDVRHGTGALGNYKQWQKISKIEVLQFLAKRRKRKRSVQMQIAKSKRAAKN
ncbi:MAG TPA: hypothetical protein VJH69_01075 [Candidatus Paceibacterota bacterium]